MATSRITRQNKAATRDAVDSYICDTESEDEVSHLISSPSEDCQNSVEHSKKVSDAEESVEHSKNVSNCYTDDEEESVEHSKNDDEEESVEHSKGDDEESVEHSKDDSDEEESVEHSKDDDEERVEYSKDESDEEESVEHSKDVNEEEESDIPLSIEASMNLLREPGENDAPLSIEASMNLLSGASSPNVSSALASKHSSEDVTSKSSSKCVPSKATPASKSLSKGVAFKAALKTSSQGVPSKATPDPLAKWLTPRTSFKLSTAARAPVPLWSKLSKTKKKIEIDSDSETSEESEEEDYKSATDSPMWSKPRRNKMAEVETESESSDSSEDESYKSANEFARSVRKQVRPVKASPPLRRSCRTRNIKLVQSDDDSSDDDVTFAKNVKRASPAPHARSDNSSESDDELSFVHRKKNNASRIMSDSESDSENSADDSKYISDDNKENVSHVTEDNQSKKADDSDDENISGAMEKCLNIRSVQNKKCYVDLPNISAVLKADNKNRVEGNDKSEESANESKGVSDDDKENVSHATEDSVDKIWCKFGQSKSVNDSDEENLSKAMEKCLNLCSVQAKKCYVDLPNINAEIIADDNNHIKCSDKSSESEESANESKGVSEDDEENNISRAVQANKNHCDEVTGSVDKTVSGSPVWGEPRKIAKKKVVETNGDKSDDECFESETKVVQNNWQENELESGSLNYTPLKESQFLSEKSQPQNNSDEILNPTNPSKSSTGVANEIDREIEKLVEGIKDNEYGGLTERLPDGGARLRQVNHLLGEVIKTPRKNCEEMAKPLAAIVQSELASTRRKLALLRGAGSKLPDGGQQLLYKLGEAEKEIAEKEAQVKKNQSGEEIQSPSSLIREAWQAQRMNLQSFLSEEREKMLEQLTQKKVSDTKVNPRSIIMEALKMLHNNLETMPSEDMVVDQPAGLRSSIQLFPHQKQALSWLLWRETQHPAGGILADDMGFGKTLTMISLILKQKELEEEREQADKENKKRKKSFRSKATLVVCPTSLLLQWEKEVDTRVEKGRLRTLVYHGSNKKWSARTLADYDLVITTYQTVQAEVKAELGELAEQDSKITLSNLAAAEDLASTGWNLLAIDWGRIILDDAHKLRSPRSLSSKAVCRLRAERRWCLTGAPVQNKELNLYPLVRFLRFSPFDEYRIWKVWIDDKHVSMSTLVKSVLLRRTRKEKTQRKCVVDMPKIQMTKDEKKIYLGSELRSRPIRDREAAKKTANDEEENVEEEVESEDELTDESDEDFNPSDSEDTDN